jgi:hypothetical protein
MFARVPVQSCIKGGYMVGYLRAEDACRAEATRAITIGNDL